MKFHTSLPVRDIQQTIAFYSKLFAEGPVKQRDDYAKFLPRSVALNLTFHQAKDPPAALRSLHLGFELADRAALDAVHARLTEAGLVAEPREEAVCCYANQDKFWVEDPDGYRWELYYLVNDAGYKNDPQMTCCGGTDPQQPSCCG